MDLRELYGFLLRHLTRDVMPFWIRYSVDWQNGGMWTCLADDGSILNRDKYIWSNARGLWTFSAPVNRIALPVQDPYHLPRGLIIAIETLERLIG